MAIAVTRILPRRPVPRRDGSGSAPTVPARVSRPAGEIEDEVVRGTAPEVGGEVDGWAGAGLDPLPRRAGGLPHELVFRVDATSRRAAVRQVHVESDEAAVLADWWSRGRVELMAASRPFVLEADLDGRGIRLVEPMGRVPVAAFEPGRRGGRVHLSDGATLHWLAPTRHTFVSGFEGDRNAGIIRFALDGTALVLVDPDALDPRTARMLREPGAGSGHACRGDVADPRLGWMPDVVGLLVLGWFLRLVACADGGRTRSGVRHLGV